MSEKKQYNVALNNVTITFPSVYQKAVYEGQETKYQTGIILKKNDANYNALKAKYDAICQEAIASKKLTRTQLTPWIRPLGGTKGIVVDCAEDPDKYQGPRFENAVILTAKNDYKPYVVNGRREPIDEAENQIYGGCVCNVNVDLYIYHKVYKGIGVQLNGIQKVRDGEPFGAARLSVEDMFDEIDEATMYD